MRKDNENLFDLLMSEKRWANLTIFYYLRFREISKIVNPNSFVVIQFALAIEVAYFFEVKRKKRYNVKRDLKGNAHQKGGQAEKHLKYLLRVILVKCVNHVILIQNYVTKISGNGSTFVSSK